MCDDADELSVHWCQSPLHQAALALSTWPISQSLLDKISPELIIKHHKPIPSDQLPEFTSHLLSRLSSERTSATWSYYSAIHKRTIQKTSYHTEGSLTRGSPTLGSVSVQLTTNHPPQALGSCWQQREPGAVGTSATVVITGSQSP